MNAYAYGKFAPGRCSDWLNLNCTGGDSGTEPYLAAHYQLLAHSAAVKLYKTKYQVLFFKTYMLFKFGTGSLCPEIQIKKT